MSSDARLRRFASGKLDRLKAKSLYRELKPTVRLGDGHTVRAGQELISFCDNDYLGLAHEPNVVAAAQAAITKWGVGSGASRLVTGDHPLNTEVEGKLAAMKGTDGARLFGSGYLANTGLVPTLVGPDDLIIMDELSHACMHSGAQLSRAKIELFKHNDVVDLEAKLAAWDGAGHCLVMTETVFSMDGDIAPLAEIGALCERYEAWMMTDDAHGLGVLKLDNPAHIQMGTLSKAVGGYGGYVCGPSEVMELLTNRARTLIFTTGLPPAVLAGASAALDVIAAEPERGKRALAHARLFCELVGLPVPATMVVPVIIGAADRSLRLSATLLDAGYLVSAIRPPTVPKGTARLRFTFCATHNERDVRGVAKALNEAMATA